MCVCVLLVVLGDPANVNFWSLLCADPYLPPHNVTSLKLRGIAVAAARVSVKYDADGQFSAELLSGPAIQVCNVDSVCQKLTPSSTPAMFTWTSGETFKFTVL
eukprot:m.645732 g.645732  ORF g.645732 m.645732 type:complete len:103 (+) comp22651_c0_seq29:2290-2598(+)